MLSCFRDKKNKIPTLCNFEVEMKNVISEWRSQWRMIQKRTWY